MHQFCKSCRSGVFSAAIKVVEKVVCVQLISKLTQPKLIGNEEVFPQNNVNGSFVRASRDLTNWSH